MWNRVLEVLRRKLSAPAGRPRRRSARPRVIELEDRAVPATFLVTNLNDSGPGSLRQAVLDANVDTTPDDIQFTGAGASGTISLASGPMVITNPVTIAGPGASALTVTGNNAQRIFQIQTTPGAGVPVNISGLTLTAGNAVPGNSGGAIYSQYANLTVADSILTGNHASHRGGAIFSGYSNARLTVRNSTITGNSATNYGGAIYSRSYAGTVIENTTISNSQANSYGGGMYLSSSPLDLRDSTVANNRALNSQGGGFYLTSSSLQMRNSTLSGNIGVSYGGGFYQQSGSTSLIEGSTISGNRVTGVGGAAWIGNTTMQVRNSTVSGNSASSNGGGFYFNTSPATIRNSTIAHNTASSTGGGIFVVNQPATIESSIVANNRATASPTTDDVYNINTLHATRSLFRVTPGGNGINGTNTANLTGVDPQLGPLQNNGGPTLSHAIPSTSPAVDAGSNSGALTVDQRGTGFARAENGTADMGAVEWDTALVTNINDAGPGSLRAAIAAANTEPDATPVRFATGVTGTIVLTTGDVTPNNPVDLQGPGVGLVTIAENATNRFLAGAGVPVSASGLTLSNPDGLAFSFPVTNTGDLTLDAGTGDVSFSAPLSVGTGTLTITDGNEVDLGPTTLLAGGTLSAANGFVLGLGETLSGTGTVTGSVTVGGGLISPGPFGGSGDITINGDLHLTDGQFVTQLEGPAFFDRLVVNGLVDLGGGSNWSPELLFAPTAGTGLTLVANDGTDPVVGLLNGIPNRGPVTFNGVLFQMQYDGGDGNDVVLVANAAPTLNPGVVTNLNPIFEDVPASANPGTTLDDLLGNVALYADAAGTTRPGLAVTGLDGANGTWQFSTNGGAAWTDFGSVSPTAATVLRADDAGQTRIRFRPNANFAGAATIAFRGWDGLDGSANGTAGVDASAGGGNGVFSTQTEIATLAIFSTNDPPDAVNDTATLTEDAAAHPILVLANDSVGPEAGDVLTVLAVTQPRHGTVSIAPGGLSVLYTPEADYAGPDNFVYTVSDGSGGIDMATVSVTVANDFNDRLEVVTTPGMATFTEGLGAVDVDAGLQLGTADEGTITMATVRFARGYVPKKDILTYTQPVGIAITGKFSPATGVLTLTGAASPADYEAALQKVRYTNPSAAPVAGVRAINIRVQDSAGLGEPATRLLNVVAVNTRPILTLTGPALTYTRGRPGVAVATTLKITDPDSTRLLSTRVAIGAFQAGDVLDVVTKPGIIRQYDALTGILTLTGNSTLANFLAVLKTVKFRTTAAGGPARTIGFTVTDATGLTSLEVTRTVNVV